MNSFAVWAFLGKTYIDQFGPNQLIVRRNFCDQKYLPYIKRIPLIYQNVILPFSRAKQLITINDEHIFLDQVLRGNIHFLCDTSESRERQTFCSLVQYTYDILL